MQYVLHFPQGEKYVSIVKRAATAEAQALLDSERSRLRGLIAQQLTEAAMLAEPDEGNALRAAWAHAHMVRMPRRNHCNKRACKPIACAGLQQNIRPIIAFPMCLVKLRTCVQEGTANSSNASDDFFLQDGDPEEAAATHASQHAPTNKQVPAQAAGKAPIPTRGGVLIDNGAWLSRWVSSCLTSDSTLLPMLHALQAWHNNNETRGMGR